MPRGIITQPFVSFSLLSGARTDVVRARSDTNPGLLPQLPLVFLVISGLSGSLFYQLFICTWKHRNIPFHILHMKMPKTRPKTRITGYVHSVINMHTICMQIMSLEIATISITSALLFIEMQLEQASCWGLTSSAGTAPSFLSSFTHSPLAQRRGRHPSVPFFEGGSLVCLIVCLITVEHPMPFKAPRSLSPPAPAAEPQPARTIPSPTLSREFLTDNKLKAAAGLLSLAFFFFSLRNKVWENKSSTVQSHKPFPISCLSYFRRI